MRSCYFVLAIILSLVSALHPHDVTDLAPRAKPTITSGANNNQCCFVIQDHLSVNYWARTYLKSDMPNILIERPQITSHPRGMGFER